MATGLRRAGKAVKGKTEIGISDFAIMIGSFVSGIMERGKAKPGDKTIINSLLPASKALRLASEKGESLEEGFR